jgi:alkylation response protein AidB-like acyl-CoA dehydrogenase
LDFELSEELKMIQSLAKDFVEGQLKPLERDILGKAADLSDAHAFLSPEKENELIKQVKDLGLWGLGVPEELGGPGLNTLGVCLVEEELANTIIPFNFGDVTPILFDCSQSQKQKYLIPALNNEKRPYLALMENGQKDPAGMQMKAEKSGSGYILNGKKLTLSRPAEDYFAVVFARTEKGISCFLVDKDTPGFTVSGVTERNGWLSRVREPLELSFTDCRVAAENLLGAEGKAFKLGEKWLPQRRVVRGARAVGIARRLLEEAAVQAQAASAYGQVAAKRTSIRVALTEMAADIHAARLMVYEAACKADAGQNTVKTAVMVKYYTSRILRGVTDMVAHIFNGPSCAGMTVEKLCRHAMENNIRDIALEKQVHIISGDILKGLKV